MNILLIFSLLVSLSINCIAQKSALVLNLKENTQYTQTSSSTANIIQEVNGQKVNMSMNVGGHMVYFVTAVTNEGFIIDVSYKSLSMTMDLPQGTVEFNSEKVNTDTDIFSMVLKEMKNKKFQITMTRFGKISEVRNIDQLFNSVFDKFPDMPESQKLQIKSQLSKSYGATAFKGNIEMITAIYPESRVKVGDEWNVNTKLESGISANINTTYSFSKRMNNYYQINGVSKIKTANKDAYFESNGMPMRYDLSGTMTSVIKIDKESGWIIEAKISQSINGDTFIKENPQLPNGMNIPMTMTSEMTYEGS